MNYIDCRALKSKNVEDWDKYKNIRNKHNIFIKMKMKNYVFDKNFSYFKSSNKYWKFYNKYVKTKPSATTQSIECNQFVY